MTDEQTRSKRLRYNRILGRLDSVIAALVATKPSFILEQLRQEYKAQFDACVYAELGQLSTQPLPLSSVVQRHFRGLVLDTSKNVVAFTCPDVENLECDWNITAALKDLLADDLTEERPKRPNPDAVQTTSEHMSTIASNQAIQAPAVSTSLPYVSPSVQLATSREQLLSDFIDPAFLEESHAESPPLSILCATENMELLSNFLHPELLREVMSVLKPDKDDASTSASADVAEKDGIACQPVPELLNEALSVLKPDQDDASTSACEGTAEQSETASGLPAEGRHTKKNRRKNARRAAFRAELLKFALHGSDELFGPAYIAQPLDTMQHSADNTAGDREEPSEVSSTAKVLSMSKPGKEESPLSAADSEQEHQAPRASNAKSRKAFKVLLHKFVLYDFEETSDSLNSQGADEASHCSGHPASKSHDTLEREVNETNLTVGGKLRKRYWAKLTNPPETVLERTVEHNAASDEESGPWRPQMATKCRIADGCANRLAEESPGQQEEKQTTRDTTTSGPRSHQGIHYHPPPSESTNRTFAMEYPKYRVRRDSLWAMSWQDIEEDYPRAVFFGLKAVDFLTRGKVSSMLYPGYS